MDGFTEEKHSANGGCILELAAILDKVCVTLNQLTIILTIVLDQPMVAARMYIHRYAVLHHKKI
jgi:hypothetical protein